jgi:hypothetical protein
VAGRAAAVNSPLPGSVRSAGEGRPAGAEPGRIPAFYRQAARPPHTSLTRPPGQPRRGTPIRAASLCGGRGGRYLTDAHPRNGLQTTAPAGAACCQTGRQVRALAPEPPDESRPGAGAARLVTHCERTLRTDAPFAGAAAGAAAAGRGTPLSEQPGRTMPRDLDMLAGWCAGPQQARVRAGPRAARGRHRRRARQARGRAGSRPRTARRPPGPPPAPAPSARSATAPTAPRPRPRRGPARRAAQARSAGAALRSRRRARRHL